MTQLDTSPPSQQLKRRNSQILPLIFSRVGWGSWHKNLSKLGDSIVYSDGYENELLNDENVVNATTRFLSIWERLGESGPANVDIESDLALVRGLFGAWIPNNMKAAQTGLGTRFSKVVTFKTTANATAEQNGAVIAIAMLQRLEQGNKVHLLCHSKGGLETLLAIAENPRLVQAVGSLSLVQTARKPSPVLAHWLAQPRYFPYPALFGLLQARLACEELCDPYLGALVAQCVAAISFLVDAGVPIISVASSSKFASKSLESQHRLMHKLFEVRSSGNTPIHDGLFETHSLVWHTKNPRVKQIYLPDLDHSQPGVGGSGFDAARFWLALAFNAIDGVNE
jgi:hypothetical protein